MEPLSEISASFVTLRETGKFSKIIMDLVENAPELKPFYGNKVDIDGFATQIEQRKNFSINRKLLASALSSQYNFTVNPRVKSNIAALREENTFTVTTGHQLNIFTGPIYFHYKILTTIKLAEELTSHFPAYKFVPVYWMNTEDHDIEEVGQMDLFGHKYKWNPKQHGATGRMDCTELSGIVSQLQEKLRSEHAKEYLKLFSEAYKNSNSLAEATRKFTDSIYGNQGLVILNSDDKTFKSSFAGMVENELTTNTIFDSIKESDTELKKHGYHAQVSPREINLFWLDENGRNRIESQGDQFRIVNTDKQFSLSDLLEIQRTDPQKISYNVVTRPLFQEFILPNLAYVGGGGELAYWLQYKKMFQACGVSFPILVLRDSFLIIDKRSSKVLKDSNILDQDLFEAEELLINGMIEKQSGAELEFSDQQKLLTDFFDLLETKASSIEQGLANAVNADRARQQKMLEGWKGRIKKALKKREEVSVNRVRKAHNQLFPSGGLQERSLNILEAIEKYGPDFLVQIKAHEEPLSTNKYAILRY